MYYIDQESLRKNCNIIFREFEKINDTFIATNNFYLSDTNNNESIHYVRLENNKSYSNCNEKIIQSPINKNMFMLSNTTDMFDLLLISTISFYLDETDINKSYLIKRYLDNDIDIDDKILEDLYFNNEFAQKINISLPKKIDNINKKYLFKINFTELNKSFFYENNKLVL